MSEIIDIDPDTGEVLGRGDEVTLGTLSSPSSGESPTPRPEHNAPLPATIEAHTYRPQLVLEPDAARTLVEQVKAMQRSVLVQGTDYDVIPGTGKKPTLLKPGAERLLQVFGLGHRMEVLEYDEDAEGRKTGVTYRCTVSKTLADGTEITVSSCDGHASTDEPKWRKAPWNTVIKMAQKRALVGASLTATATSGLFTQDVEDGGFERTAAPRYEPGPGGPPAGTGDGITDGQITLIQTLFTEQGIKSRDAKIDICSNAVGRRIESTKELTKREASVVVDHLKARAR